MMRDVLVAVLVVAAGMIAGGLALLVMDDAMFADWDAWRVRRRSARRARSDCLCCRGYPVCWVEQTGDYYPRPAEQLCSRHKSRWAHIRDLERELWPPAPPMEYCSTPPLTARLDGGDKPGERGSSHGAYITPDPLCIAAWRAC